MFVAGGWVMWPLLALSVVSVALSVERAAFWLRTNGAGGRRMIAALAIRLRRGDRGGAYELASTSTVVYARFVAALIGRASDEQDARQPRISESAAFESIERVRPVVERFSPTLSTIITAAPLLGILGTVTGIIQSFQLLGRSEAVTDPAAVAAGIAQALYTTAFGLTVALVTLFPFAVFRAQSSRCLNRLEMLATAALDSSEEG